MRAATPLRWTLAALTTALASSIALAGGAQSQEPGPHPGLPIVADAPPPFPAGSNRNEVSWLNGPSAGRTGSVAAKQWARLPLGMLANNIQFFTCDGPGTRGPSENRCAIELDSRVQTYYGYDIAAFFVSPAGDAVPYGNGRPFTVRTVAFGAVPVEAEIQVRQVRDAVNDLPIPLEALTSDLRYVPDAFPPGSDIELPSAQVTGQVTIHVTGLSIDAVDVDLGGTCATAPTEIALRSEALVPELGPAAEIFDVRRHADGFAGGSFAGELRIPSFTGCRTEDGDDIASLLTSALSGEGNPVVTQYGATFCNPGGAQVPISPGVDTPEKAGCVQGEAIPGNPNTPLIPVPWEFPEYAPGDGPPGLPPLSSGP